MKKLEREEEKALLTEKENKEGSENLMAWVKK